MGTNETEQTENIDTAGVGEGGEYSKSSFYVDFDSGRLNRRRPKSIQSAPERGPEKRGVGRR